MEQQATAKTLCQALEAVINDLGPGRPQSLAMTKLEEVYMWIGKAIRDHQVEQRRAPLQEERRNS